MGSKLLGIDYGRARVGLALAENRAARPQRLMMVVNGSGLLRKLQVIIAEQGVGRVVIGLPRGVDGEETAQSALTREFGRRVGAAIAVAVELQDEFATSEMARERLAGQLPTPDTHGLLDQEAAVIILEDYLAGQQ